MAALLVELALLLGCAAVLLRSTALPRSTRRTFFWYVGGLVAVHVVFSFAPAPPGPVALASSALVFFVVAAWLARRVEATR